MLSPSFFFLVFIILKPPFGFYNLSPVLSVVFSFVSLLFYLILYILILCRIFRVYIHLLTLLLFCYDQPHAKQIYCPINLLIKDSQATNNKFSITASHCKWLGLAISSYAKIWPSVKLGLRL